MFIQPPFMGSGVAIGVKERCRRCTRDISGLRAIFVWSVMVVLGLTIAALLAWLMAA